MIFFFLYLKEENITNIFKNKKIVRKFMFTDFIFIFGKNDVKETKKEKRKKRKKENLPFL